MKKVITNSAGARLPETAEAGKAITILLAPPGNYPQVIDDPEAEGGQREVVQLLDDKAMQTLVANFEKAKSEAEAKGEKYGVLVDADHSSEVSTNTAAMAWVTRLYIDPEKGLMADIEPTSLGAEKINGKVYRFVSGAWTLDDDNRPETLVSIGLTNKPNLPVAPIINAKQGADANGKDGAGTSAQDADGVTHDSPPADANAAGAEKTEKTETETPPDAAQNADAPAGDGTNKEAQEMNEIKTLLGLPEEATDEDVKSAVTALIEKCKGMENVQEALGLEATASNEEVLEAVNAVVNQCGELQAQNEAAEQERVETEAAEFVEANADVIPEEVKEEIKDEYIEDKEKAEATVANFRRVHERAILNATKTARKERVINTVVAKKPAEPVVANSELPKFKTVEEQQTWLRAHPNG